MMIKLFERIGKCEPGEVPDVIFPAIKVTRDKLAESFSVAALNCEPRERRGRPLVFLALVA